ncbi:MAG TPA: radical SAM protein [Candidatus Merdenecus merdavium]|nr:radical SAM protein [Candidatus Merdenecus merdavium]
MDKGYETTYFTDYVLITERQKNVCFKMPMEQYSSSQESYINGVIDSITKLRKKKNIEPLKGLDNRLNTLYLFVTNSCNLKCSFCSMRSDNPNVEKNSLMVEEISDEFIDKIETANPRKIIISGGEPFILKDIVVILSKLRERLSSQIIVQSNGWLLSEELIADIKGKVDSIELSTAHMLDLVRLESLVSLLKINEIDTVLTFIYENELDVKKMKEVMDICAKYDSDFLLHFVDYAGSAADKQYKFLEYEDRLKVYLLFIKYMLDEDYCKKRFATNLFYSTQLSHPCSAYGKMAAVFPDGNIYLCHTLTEDKYQVGMLNENFSLMDQINKVTHDEKVEKLFNIENNEKCSNCKFKVICGGICPNLIDNQIESDCTLRKIMYSFNIFKLDKNISIRDNLLNFVEFCDSKEYLKYILD